MARRGCPRHTFCTIALVGLLPSFVGPAHSRVAASRATIYVHWDGSADFTSIQDAVNYASAGDTIYVYAGTYFENVVVDKAVSLLSELGPQIWATIYGNGTGDVVRLESDDVLLSGFIVTNSGSTCNEFSDCDAGIEIDGSQYCTVTDCVLSGNQAGLTIANASFNTVTNCFIENNYHGIFAYALDFGGGGNTANEIVGNVISSNTSAGIRFVHDVATYHYLNIVQDNAIVNNGTGIAMIMSQENDIAYNTIACNAWYGISVGQCIGCGSDNMFHHNDFVFNNDGGVQAGDWWYPSCGTNYWYSPAESQGNYWSDYDGPDSDGDGIGDLPYEFDGQQDPYPLMHLYLDFAVLADCMSGPDVGTQPPGCDPLNFAKADLDGDGDIDLADFAQFQRLFAS